MVRIKLCPHGSLCLLSPSRGFLQVFSRWSYMFLCGAEESLPIALIRAVWFRFTGSLNWFPCETKLNYVSTLRAEKNIAVSVVHVTQSINEWTNQWIWIQQCGTPGQLCKEGIHPSSENLASSPSDVSFLLAVLSLRQTVKPSQLHEFNFVQPWENRSTYKVKNTKNSRKIGQIINLTFPWYLVMGCGPETQRLWFWCQIKQRMRPFYSQSGFKSGGVGIECWRDDVFL